MVNTVITVAHADLQTGSVPLMDLLGLQRTTTEFQTKDPQTSKSGHEVKQ